MRQREFGSGRPVSSSALLGVAMVAAASIAFVACGSGSKSTTPGKAVTDQTRQTTLSMGQASGSEPPTEEFGMTETQLVASIERVEALIASCMTDAGFEYVPIDAVTFREAMNAYGTAPGISDGAYVAQYGFGISTLPPTADFGAGEQNNAILKGLTPSDQVAYTRTLLGDDTEATFVFTLESEDFTAVGGCTGSAIGEVFTKEQLSDTYFNPIDKQIEADPRFLAAREQWASCMRDKGFDYGHPDDIEDEVREQLATIAEGANPASLTGSQRDALTRLQGEERAKALANLDCETRFVTDVEKQIEQDLFGRNPG